MRYKIAFLLALAGLTGSCGSSGNPSTSATAGPLTGNWQMTLTDTSTNSVAKSQSGSLIQTGNAVTGGLLLTDAPCTGIGAVSGTVTGTAVSLSLNPVGVSVNLTGTLAASPAALSGAYTILSTGCQGSAVVPESGTFTASLVSPLQGSVSGAFTSQDGASTYPITGTLTQAPITASATTSLSGTLAFTGFCYPSVNLLGSISGTSVVMNLVLTDGSSIGQFNGATSLDGTSLTGKYTYDGLGSGAPKGCVDGGAGSATLTVGG
jgi:hypothetical protein